MSVYINFKICDNADECSGISVCPVNVLYWDEMKKTVSINNEHCICCDACMDACPAGAIRVAHNDDEARQIQDDIASDPRTIQDLMVERYGASPVNEDTLISAKEAKCKISEKSLIVIEIIDDNDAPCLINSVPISEAFGSTNVEYYKVAASDKEYSLFAEQYIIIEVPTLLVFNSGELQFRVDGAVENGDYQQRTNFIEKIKGALNG